MTSDDVLRAIVKWLGHSPKNTPMDLSARLGYSSNIVRLWLKNERVPFPSRTGPQVIQAIKKWEIEEWGFLTE